MGGFDWYSGGSGGSETKSVPATTSRTTVWTITPLGKQKIPQYEGAGMTFNILTTLATNGPSSTGEVIKECGGTWSEMTYKLEALASLGYVVSSNAKKSGGGGLF